MMMDNIHKREFKVDSVRGVLWQLQNRRSIMNANAKEDVLRNHMDNLVNVLENKDE